VGRQTTQSFRLERLQTQEDLIGIGEAVVLVGRRLKTAPMTAEVLRKSHRGYLGRKEKVEVQDADPLDVVTPGRKSV